MTVGSVEPWQARRERVSRDVIAIGLQAGAVGELHPETCGEPSHLNGNDLSSVCVLQMYHGSPLYRRTFSAFQWRRGWLLIRS